MSTVEKILKDLGLNKEQAAREYAIFALSQKIAEYGDECKAYEKKYNMSFTNLEQKILESSVEVFKRDEDYLAWKFAKEGKVFWQGKIEALLKE